MIFFVVFFWQDPFPLGEIIISSESVGFSVDETAPVELGGGDNAFVLNTPTRSYPLLAETGDEKHSWIAVLRAVIHKCSTLPRGANLGDTYDNE